MTKDAYYEMCEMMNSEPVHEEIPVDYEDLFVDVQEALNIYSKLKDEWDGMNGTYMGKNYSGLLDIFTVLDVPVEDRKTMFELIGLIDKYRSDAIAARKPKSDK
jgi:hypothetical protein